MLRLKSLRKERKETQKQIADILGVTQATLSGWENGKYEIDNNSLIKLAHHFNVSVDYLLGNSDNREDIESNQAKKNSDMDESISDEDIKFAARLYSVLVESKIIRPGEDLTPKQFEILSGLVDLIAKSHEQDD